MSGANEKQIDGSHYQATLQHWDLLPLLGYGPEYFVGQASKYVARWRKKNGIPDLRKGQHFVEKLAELAEQGPRFIPYHSLVGTDVQIAGRLDTFFKANQTEPAECAIIDYLVFARTVEELQGIVKLIENLIQKETLVTDGYEFIEYTEDDTVRWRKTATGEELDLPLTALPMHAHWR